MARLVDLTLMKHGESPKAIKVSNDGDEDTAVWLPRSQIEVEIKQGDLVEVTMPEWLAKEKELI